MPKSFLLNGKKKTSWNILNQQEREEDGSCSDISTPDSPCSNHDDLSTTMETEEFQDSRNAYFNPSESSAFSKIYKPDIGPMKGQSAIVTPYMTPSSFPKGFFPSPFVSGFPLTSSSQMSKESPPVRTNLSGPLHFPSSAVNTDEQTNCPGSNRNDSDSNIYYYVDPSIPFTNYFLNLTKLLSKSCSAKTPLSKVGEESRADDREHPISPKPRRDEIKHEPEEMMKKSRSPSPENIKKSEEYRLYSVNRLENSLKNAPSISPYPISASFDNSFLQTAQKTTLLPLPGAGIFHPALMPMSAQGFRRFSPEKPPPIKKYKCDVCGKAFSRSNTLVTHKRIHTGDKPFKCELCGRAFRQPGNLTRHRLTHTTVKPYVCPTCNKAFNRASNLNTHMRTHTAFKPFVCPFCGKGFHQKIDMKIHCYTHTGERPHKCEMCGKGFTLASTLNAHKRTHITPADQSSTRMHLDSSQRHTDDQQ